MNLAESEQGVAADRMPVPLTKGYTAWVSPEDYERVTRHKWCAIVTGARADGTSWVYAIRNLPRTATGQKQILLHRFLTNAPPDQQVDHISGDTLDCTRGNLRLATPSQNNRNRKKSSGTTSRFKGVYWHAQARRWIAKICVDGKVSLLGRFASETDAAAAYDEAARNVHGAFARLNFPDRHS